MQIIPATIFKCDHCGKRQFRKGDMTKHEKWCKKNPNNQHKCFQFCKHLIKDKEDYDGGYDNDFQPQRTTFTCAITGKQMYSFKAERRGLVDKLVEVERMPLECDKYEDMNPMYFTEDVGDFIDDMPY